MMIDRWIVESFIVVVDVDVDIAKVPVYIFPFLLKGPRATYSE